jgi:hypothetical protein
MSRLTEDRDREIIRGLVGEVEGYPGVSIEQDYLVREKIENAREQGFEVPETDIFERSELERSLWRNTKIMEEVENERVGRRDRDIYDGSGPWATRKQKRYAWILAKKKGVELDEVFLDSATRDEAGEYIEELKKPIIIEF